MQLGVCVASHIGDIGYVVRAEELGFSHAWLADSQMLWSDCYATLALAASRTSRIHLGTGVAVTGTRPPPVTASSIATINAIAPGRTFLGVGAGNTALRVMGQPPQRIAAFDRYLKTLKPLLRGEEAMFRQNGVDVPIRHIMPDSGFVAFQPKIPMYVSGFGQRSLGLAGQHGDGAVVGVSNPQGVAMTRRHIEAGAREVGRTLARGDYLVTSLCAISVLDPGETADSPRIRHECGAMAMATVHYAYDQWRNFGQEPPPHLRDMWPEYTALLAQVPEERVHQRIHAGHNCWVIPEEEHFVTGSLVDATCMVGTRDQMLERLAALYDAGLDQVMILPAFAPRYENLERVGKELIPQLQRMR